MLDTGKQQQNLISILASEVLRLVYKGFIYVTLNSI